MLLWGCSSSRGGGGGSGVSSSLTSATYASDTRVGDHMPSHPGEHVIMTHDYDYQDADERMSVSEGAAAAASDPAAAAAAAVVCGVGFTYYETRPAGRGGRGRGRGRGQGRGRGRGGGRRRGGQQPVQEEAQQGEQQDEGGQREQVELEMEAREPGDGDEVAVHLAADGGTAATAVDATALEAPFWYVLVGTAAVQAPHTQHASQPAGGGGPGQASRLGDAAGVRAAGPAEAAPSGSSGSSTVACRVFICKLGDVWALEELTEKAIKKGAGRFFLL